MSENKVRVGSRKSEVSTHPLKYFNSFTLKCSYLQLALIQTRHVIACLNKIYPEKEFEIGLIDKHGKISF